MTNTYFAKVTVAEVVGYTEDTTTTFEKFFTVSAESESEAYAKINDYFNSRASKGYSTYYILRDINVFEHID